MDSDKKIALITGISGQDGSYLAEYLLIKRNYEIHGIIRHENNPNIDTIKNQVILHCGDLNDSLFITNLINTIQPDEI